MSSSTNSTPSSHTSSSNGSNKAQQLKSPDTIPQAAEGKGTNNNDADSIDVKLKKNTSCWTCCKDGHVSKNCPTPKQDGIRKGSSGSGQKSFDMSCFYCGGKGHYKKDCPLLQPREYTRNQPKGGEKSSSRNGGRDEIKESRDKEMGRGRVIGRGRGNEQKSRKEYGNNDVQVFGRGRGRGRGEYRKEYSDQVVLYDQFSSLPPFLDTHCHVEYLMERLRIRKYRELARRYHYPHNYDGCITSFCDPAGLSSLSQADQLLAEGNIWGSYGMHPHHAAYFTDNLEDKLISRLKDPKCVAFGEIGLDYSEHSLEQSSKEKQKEIFKRLLTMAPIFDKPLLLHCRDADDDLYSIMRGVVPPTWKIHLHCFTGTLEMAQKFTTDFQNLYIGVTGHVTYNKFRQTRDVVRTLPLNRILLETDAPYMPPAGVEERWSHPPMVAYVAEEIARSRRTTIDEVVMETRKNATDIYGV